MNNCDCEWEEYGDKYKCKHCGFVVKNYKIKKRCEVLKPPSLTQRVMNFGEAAIKHVKNGLKHCTDEEVQQRYDICKSNKCGFFNEEHNVCMHQKCGCFIRNNGKFFDKLRWADSSCPIGLWKPVQKTQ